MLKAICIIVMRKCKFIDDDFSLYLHHIGPPIEFTNLGGLLGVLVSTLARQGRGLRLVFWSKSNNFAHQLKSIIAV